MAVDFRRISYEISLENQRAEIDYIVCPEFRRGGYGTEMMRLFLERVFREWPLYRVSAYVTLGNMASYRLLEKCGFIREGILRSWSTAGAVDEQSYDCYSYSFLVNDLEGI